MSERHRAAGQLGGLAVVARYGREWMRTIGSRGGRPTWQVTLARAYQREEARRVRSSIERRCRPHIRRALRAFSPDATGEEV